MRSSDAFNLPRPPPPPPQVILADSLPGDPKSDLIQPVWCSYAMGARSAVLIAVDGTIVYQQGWLNTDDLGTAIDGYLEEAAGGTWDRTPAEAATPRKSRMSKANTQLGQLKAQKEKLELDSLSP